MDNQRLKGLLVGWRSMETKLRTKEGHQGITDTEAWLSANAINQCIGELEALLFVDEFDKKDVLKECMNIGLEGDCGVTCPMYLKNECPNAEKVSKKE